MSKLSLFAHRSAQLLRDNAARIIRMDGLQEPSRAPIALFNFNSKQDIAQFATGCDADVGGLSTVNLDLETGSAVNGATARFWGDMKVGVRPEVQGRVRGGYAGFRNKPRPTLFGDMLEDVSNHRYLAMRLRIGGHQRTRNSYFVNIQTDGAISTDLWQHRLFFHKGDGSWEDIFIPFEDFVLTNTGEIVEHQITMMREKVRSVGISLLGGNSGVEGPYELGIDSIRAVNDEDAISPEKEGSDGTRWERGPL